jgi:hypothetical protein
VIGADLLYNPENFDALLATMLELAQMREARVFIATEQRWDLVNKEWNLALDRSGFERGAEVVLPTSSRLPRPVVCLELLIRGLAAD